jgi:hypothetical protein
MFEIQARKSKQRLHVTCLLSLWSELTSVMVQVDEGPWETCAPSAATPGLYTAPWAPALLDDTSGRPDHLLKAKNKRNDHLSHSDVYPGSRIRLFSIPDPGSRIRIKEFKYFNPKKMVSKL